SSAPPENQAHAPLQRLRRRWSQVGLESPEHLSQRLVPAKDGVAGAPVFEVQQEPLLQPRPTAAHQPRCALPHSQINTLDKALFSRPLRPSRAKAERNPVSLPQRIS